jgi:hypothetical protein
VSKSRVLIVAAAGAGAAVVLGGVAVAASTSNTVEGPTRPAPITAPAGTAAQIAQSEYVPLNPCRIADSRSSSAGIYGRNITRPLQITGTTNFTAQGGAPTGCGVPTTATAVVLSFTTSGSTGQGRLTVWPTGTTKANTTALTYYPDTKISGEVTAKIGTDGTIQVQNVSLTSTHVVADAVGYYSQPIAATVAADGTILSKSPQVTSVVKTDTGQYQVMTNVNTLKCTAVGTPQNSGYTFAAYTDQFTDRVEVYVKKASDGTYVDSAFALSVTC